MMSVPTMPRVQALHSAREDWFPCGARGAGRSYTVEPTLAKPSWNNPAKVQALESLAELSGEFLELL